MIQPTDHHEFAAPQTAPPDTGSVTVRAECGRGNGGAEYGGIEIHRQLAAGNEARLGEKEF